MSNKGSNYLLLGPETGEKEIFIHNTIRQFEHQKGSTAEISKFFAFDKPAVEIISLLQNGLLFSDCKAVIVSAVENFSKADAVIIADYLERPSPDTLLFLCSDQNRLFLGKIEEAVLPANKKIYWELLDHQKKGWIRNFFNKREMTIENDALAFIIEMVESNTKDLKMICERLEVFFKEQGVIRYEDIENYIFHSKEENVFTLFSGLVKRDFALSMEILNKIFLSHEEDPIRILSGILWQVRQCIQFFSHLKEHHTVESVFHKLSIRTKRQQRLFHQLRENYSLDELFSIVGLIAKYDVWLRSYSQNAHRILLEMFIHAMIKKTFAV